MSETHFLSQPATAVGVSNVSESAEPLQSKVLLQSARLEVTHFTFQAGQTLPRRSLSGDVTLHCLQGSVKVEAEIATAADLYSSCRGGCNAVIWPRPAPVTSTVLHAGEILYLPAEVAHIVSVEQNVRQSTVMLQTAVVA